MQIKSLIALALAVASVSSAPTLETVEYGALAPVSNAVEKRGAVLAARNPQLGVSTYPSSDKLQK